MAVVFLVPHVLMVFYLALIIQRQCYKTVYWLRKVYNSWRIFLLHLKGDLGVGVRDDFCG